MFLNNDHTLCLPTQKKKKKKITGLEEIIICCAFPGAVFLNISAVLTQQAVSDAHTKITAWSLSFSPSHLLKHHFMLMSQHWVYFLFKVVFFSKLVLSADQYLTLNVSLRWRFAVPGTSWQADPSVVKTFSHFTLTDPAVHSETALGLVPMFCVTGLWEFTYD